MADWQTSGSRTIELTSGGTVDLGLAKLHPSPYNFQIIEKGGKINMPSPLYSNINFWKNFGATGKITRSYENIDPVKPFPLIKYQDTYWGLGLYLIEYSTIPEDYSLMFIKYHYDNNNLVVDHRYGNIAINIYDYASSTLTNWYTLANVQENYNTQGVLSSTTIVLQFPVRYYDDEVKNYKYHSYESIPVGESYSNITSQLFFELEIGGEVLDPNDLPIAPTNSQTGGGGGSLSIHSDPIGIPTLPNISALGTGLLSMYKPTVNQIQALGGYLWSNDILDELDKMWSDPLELIISLGIIPFNVASGGTKTVKLGALSTGVSMSTITNQYIQIDCGTLNLAEYYANALDYSPYTSVSIFCPYCGVVELNIDDVMDSTLQVVYNIDLLSGDFVCVIKITRPNLDSVLYHYSGNCISYIPITSQNTNKLLQMAKTAGGFAAAYGGGAGALASAVAGSAMNTLGAKVTTSRSGSTSGNSGLLDNMKPYLIIERPIQSLAQNYNHFEGYPSNITYSLYELSGFTQIEEVISNTLTCPQMEQDEIINLLKGGVYL